jgi:hypothetical protein
VAGPLSLQPALASTNTPPTDSPPAKEAILEYFHKKVPSESTKRNKRDKGDKRIEYLVQAAQGFWKAASLHQNASKDI